MRWKVYAKPRLWWEAEGQVDGLSTYRLDRTGKIYEHAVDNVQVRCAPAQVCVHGREKEGASVHHGPVRPARRLAAMAGAEPSSHELAAGTHCTLRPKPTNQMPSHLAPAPPRQLRDPPITNPLFYALNWLLRPAPVPAGLPCPGSWFEGADEGNAAGLATGGGSMAESFDDVDAPAPAL